MTQKISIPSQSQPFRRQSSLGGNVSFRNVSGNEDNSFVTLARVTKVYYKQGKIDFKLTNTNIVAEDSTNDGSGSAPIPVDFFGKRANGQVFGHYRPIKIGDLIAVAYLNGHKTSPIVIGVYPTSSPDYEIISPSFYDAGNDEDDSVAETGLAEEKVYPSMQTEYRSGSGTIAKALNGHSFLTIDDETTNQYNQLWASYDNVGFFSHNGEITNPLKEKAGDWLLVHEDNPNASGNGHRTRFYVNQDGNVQIVLMGNDSAGDISVFEGSRENGFSIKHYQGIKSVKSGDLGQDVYRPDFDSATKYVEMNIGKDESVLLQALDGNKNTNLSVNPDGVYINGKLISEIIYNAGNKNDQKISDITNDIDDINQHLADKDKSDAQKDQDLQKKWADYEQRVADNAKAASEAAKSAEQAGDDAKAAGQAAVRAGDNAVSLTDDIKNRIIYYSSISNEKDVHIPGKYLIINTDTYIANGTIKTAYIEDGAISSAKIGNEAVGTAQIARAAVGTLQVADGAIGTAQIKDLAVTDEKVGNLTFNHMIGQTLDANKINVKNISGDEISADTITANHLKIGKLSEISGDLGNITKGIISAGDDPNKGVVINGLDADDPDKYTASKKAALFREVNALNASYQATLAYAQSVGIDATALQNAQQAMSDGLSPLFMNMSETTTMDHNKVVELEKALQQAISDIQNQFRYQLGTTANGKSTIYSGSQQPAHPKENDLWMKDTGSGTDIEIYNGASWVSPSLNVVNNMNTALKNMPKTFFQSAQPDPKTTQLNEGDLWYKLTKDSNGNFVYTYYKWDNSVHMWVKLLNNGEVTNQSDINDIKNNIIKNLSDQVDRVNQGQQANQNSINDIKNNIIKNLADTVNQNEQTSQNNYNQLTGQIKTAQTNAINTANANTANQINGITSNGGGRNLWLNSKTFANTNVNVNTVDYSTDSDGITEAHITGVGAGFYGAWGNIYKNNVDPFNNGDTESFSVEMKGSGDITIGREGNFTKTFTVTNEWKRYSVTGTVTSSNAAHIMYNNSGKDVNIYVRLPMVEKGAITHDWSPAPEDQTAYTDTKVGQVQTNLNNLNNDYQAKVKLLDYINGKVDKITGSVVLLDTNYDGIMISPKTGIVNTTTGNTNTVNTVLSGDHGFLISKTPNKAGSATEDIFHVDTDGNLTIKGDFVGGNISGVNFTGASLNLAGSMKVSGSILAGDDGKGNAKVIINNDGLNMTSGDINLGDDKGTHVHIANDGTLTANQANISGNITATKLLLNDPTGNGQSLINLGGKFMVDSQGTVTANKFNSTNITVTGGEIKGTTIDGNHIKGGTIDGTTITTVTIDATSTINGATINGTTINGTTFNNTIRTPTISGDFLKGKYNDFGGIDDRPIYQVNNAGNTLWHLSTAKVPIVKKHSSGNKIEFISNSTNWANPSNFYVGSSASLAYYNKLGELRVNKGTSVGDIIQVTGTVNNFSPKFDYYFVLSNPGIDLDNLYDEDPNKLDNRYGVVVGSLLHSVQGKGNRINFDDTLVVDLETSNTTSLNLGIVVSFKDGSGGFQVTSNTLILDSVGYSFSSGTDLWGLDKSTALTTSELIINPTGSIHLSKEVGLNQNDTIDGILADVDNYSLVIQPTGLSLKENSTYQSGNSAIDIKPSGIHFSGNERNMNDAKIFFGGINENSGVYMDSYGNIQGEDNSSYWRIQDSNGNFLADFPMDGSSPIQFHTSLKVMPQGADHGIRTAWVSWSATSSSSGWDNGERYPAIVQDGANWGGIAFPKSGQVTLFDHYGHYYSPDKNTGMGNYNGYGG